MEMPSGALGWGHGRCVSLGDGGAPGTTSKRVAGRARSRAGAQMEVPTSNSPPSQTPIGFGDEGEAPTAYHFAPFSYV